VSTLQLGAYGLRDVCLSVPTVVGCGGVREHVQLSLPQKERLGLQQSARVLRETIQQVEKRLGAVGAPAAEPRSPLIGVPAGGNGRTIPRTAWQTARP
jgi:L-lactate dehydrogenase